MKALVDFLLLLPVVLYQGTLAGRFSFGGVGVDVLLAVLCSLAILQGPAYGAVCGLVCGLVLDGLHGHVGLYAVQYAAAGWGVGALSRLGRFDRWVMPALSALAAYVLKECYVLIYLFFCDVLISWPLAFVKLLLSAVLTSVLLLPIHFALRMLHRWDVLQAPLFSRMRW